MNFVCTLIYYFFPRSKASFRADALSIKWHPKLNEEGEGIFEISCDNFGCFATSLRPIKFDLNGRLKNAFALKLYFTSANLYKSINTLWNPTSENFDCVSLLTQIAIIDFIFQSSLPKQANKFNIGIVLQLNDIEVPVSTLFLICVEWQWELCTFF